MRSAVKRDKHLNTHGSLLLGPYTCSRQWSQIYEGATTPELKAGLVGSGAVCPCFATDAKLALPQWSHQGQGVSCSRCVQVKNLSYP